MPIQTCKSHLIQWPIYSVSAKQRQFMEHVAGTNQCKVLLFNMRTDIPKIPNAIKNSTSVCG
ncbi:hypothetical protein COW46_02345 [Candidatus Gracilibacteria bacterium CG17_big_fil_post_rev_8_21_14_2_50_48_13]|nr:MAG: hypothetical protein COW46_02345 [Candidatus Gracilibacteria bacterium CG17_big_fil_post_rev_8_21_14_2_50_48_13]